MEKVEIFGESGFISSYKTKQFLDKHFHISIELTPISALGPMGKALPERKVLAIDFISIKQRRNNQTNQ